jgi:hypothetical protein
MRIPYAQVGDIVSIETMFYKNLCGWANHHGKGNNGFCCSHPDQEEGGDGEGYCYSFSCPIARELYNDELQALDIDGLWEGCYDPENPDYPNGVWVELFAPARTE